MFYRDFTTNFFKISSLGILLEISQWMLPGISLRTHPRTSRNLFLICFRDFSNISSENMTVLLLGIPVEISPGIFSGILLEFSLRISPEIFRRTSFRFSPRISAGIAQNILYTRIHQQFLRELYWILFQEFWSYTSSNYSMVFLNIFLVCFV